MESLQVFRFIVMLLQYEFILRVTLDKLSNVWWISEDCDNVTALFMASSVLQGPGGPEEAPSPDPSQSQQPRVQHSFVQEHFQAQYK